MPSGSYYDSMPVRSYNLPRYSLWKYAYKIVQFAGLKKDTAAAGPSRNLGTIVGKQLAGNSAAETIVAGT